MDNRRKGWSNLQVFLIWSLSCTFCLNFNHFQSTYLRLYKEHLSADIDTSAPSFSSLLTALYQSDLEGQESQEIETIIKDIVLSDPTFQDMQWNGEATKQELVNAVYQTFIRAVENKFGISCQQSHHHYNTSKIDQPSYRLTPKHAKYLSGAARIQREEFLSQHDGGIPVNIRHRAEEKDIWLLYGAQETLPSNPAVAKEVTQVAPGRELAPILSADSALENCGQMNVIYIREDNYVGECIALVPGKVDSLMVQKWLRLDDTDDKSTLDMKRPLRLVPRLRPPQQPATAALPPERKALEINRRQRNFLGEFLSDVDGMIAELKPIVSSIAQNNQIALAVVNAGQFDFLINFACVAKARGIPIRNMLVFTSSLELKHMVEDLGMAAYHNQKYMGKLPDNADEFGGKTFGKMVAIKQIAPYLISCMGYDFLFQDVDIIWYRDPFTFFADPKKADPSFDMYFQDDNNHWLDQMPFRGNSGTYYVRNNVKTQKLFLDAIVTSDRIDRIRSDQQAMAANLFANAASYGLKVKTYNAIETEYFPIGYHYHYDFGFMKRLLRGETETYIFHMNWALERDTKVKALKQMSIWYVNDHCVDKTLDQMQEAGNIEGCCSAEPLFSCHYSDRASTQPCVSSPKLDSRSNKEFWDAAEIAKFNKGRI